MSLSRPQKSASLTLFEFDDSPIRTLAQNAQINLQHCIDGYDRSVLLKREFVSAGQTRPDVLLDPTRSNFVSQLRQLAIDGYFVDIYSFAHGGPGRINLSTGNISIEYLEQELSREKTGRSELPIRICYQMNCHGRTMNQTWLKLGAKAVCGSRYVNFLTNGFNAFGRAWKGGELFEKAVYDANTAASRTVMHLLIVADSLARPGPLRCPLPTTVLGDGPCAESYFREHWLAASEWQEDMSGKENMHHSSFMFTPGQNFTWHDETVRQWHP